MNNAEIDARLRLLSQALPEHAQKLSELAKRRAASAVDAGDAIARELEILNMSMMAVFTMLGEIAKRLPEP